MRAAALIGCAFLSSGLCFLAIIAVPSGAVGHADINTRFLRITLWIFRLHFSEFSSGGAEQHDINVVVQLKLRFRAQLSERAAFH